MRKSRKFVILIIDKKTKQIGYKVTNTTKDDLDDESLKRIIDLQILKIDKTKVDYAWEILR
jgi:hypothetical protein